MVETDETAVERDLVEGRLACPACEGELRPWGFARWRVARDRRREHRHRPRRSRCRACAITHVLVPVFALVRRRDLVEVIGTALLSKQAGAGHRAIATGLGLPPTTVRGWLRRFTERAADVREHFTRMAHALDPELGAIEPRASPFADGLEAIGVAASAGARALGPAPVWHFAAGASGGLLLANTSSPLAGLA